jgi:hypothetical protein
MKYVEGEDTYFIKWTHMDIHCKSGRLECECCLTGVIWESFNDEIEVELSWDLTLLSLR